MELGAEHVMTSPMRDAAGAPISKSRVDRCIQYKLTTIETLHRISNKPVNQ